MTTSRARTCINALSTWGTYNQTQMFVEEAAEATVAMSHYHRGRCGVGDVVGELADVQIMLDQLKICFGEDNFERVLAEKYKALKTKLDLANERRR